MGDRMTVACYNFVLPTWGIVTLILSISGLLGGLAFHLVENTGNVRWPHRVKGQAPVTHFGIFADLIVGFAASNAIHLAISGLVSYEESRTDSARFYLTFIALGVLSGFGGATLLRALSDKLRETIGKEEFDGLKDQVAKETERREILETGRIERMVEDALLYRREPKETDLALLALKVAEIDEKKPADQTPEEKLILAYQKTEEDDFQAAILLIESALKENPPEGWCWMAYNLLGISYHYDMDHRADWFPAAERSYLKALAVLEASAKPDATHHNQEAVTKTNLAYACLDHGQHDRCLELIEEVLLLEEHFSSAMPLISSVALLAKASVLALTAKPADALEILKKINKPHQVKYLFDDGSIPEAARKSLGAIKELPEAFRKFLG